MESPPSPKSVVYSRRRSKSDVTSLDVGATPTTAEMDGARSPAKMLPSVVSRIDVIKLVVMIVVMVVGASACYIYRDQITDYLSPPPPPPPTYSETVYDYAITTPYSYMAAVAGWFY